MSLRVALAEGGRRLTAADRRVVDILMRDMRASALMPAADVAAQADVHESTVVRLAQKLGYSGFPEMREAIRGDVRELDEPHSRLVKLNTERGYDLTSLVAAEANALLRLPDHLSQDEIEAAATLCLNAQHIVIHGNHFAVPLTTFLDRRLRLLGFRTSSLAGMGGRELAEHAVTIGEDDVLFAFAFRREPEGLQTLLDRCDQVGANTIVLTDTHSLSFNPRPTRTLVAPRGVDEDFRTQVVPYMVCYALQLALYNLAPERCEAAMNVIDDLTRAETSHQPTSTRSQPLAHNHEGAAEQ